VKAAGGEQALVQGDEEAGRVGGGDDGDVQARLLEARVWGRAAAGRPGGEYDRQAYDGKGSGGQLKDTASPPPARGGVVARERPAGVWRGPAVAGCAHGRSLGSLAGSHAGRRSNPQFRRPGQAPGGGRGRHGVSVLSRV
jgi:hypothetical protein